MARELGAGPVAVPTLAASPPGGLEDSPMLAAEIEHHLADMERRKLAPDTITESRHTLRIFLATTGDIPIRQTCARRFSRSESILRRTTLPVGRPN